MVRMLSSPVGRLRLIGLVEGTSYLLLLGVAMPLKYFAQMPIAVRIAGGIHGGLFIAFCFALAQVFFANKWPFSRGAFVFASSLVPFGTYLIDARLKREEIERSGGVPG